jgi:hypothetical protein
MPMVEASVPPIPAIFRKLRRVRGAGALGSGITERWVEVNEDEAAAIIS